jgi:hypothetical protein
MAIFFHEPQAKSKLRDMSFSQIPDGTVFRGIVRGYKGIWLKGATVKDIFVIQLSAVTPLGLNSAIAYVPGTTWAGFDMYAMVYEYEPVDISICITEEAK